MSVQKFTTSLIGALALAACGTTSAASPDSPSALVNSGTADFRGVWWPIQPEGADFKPDPQLTESAQTVWDEIRQSLANGKVVLDSTAACVPPGTPRLMTRVYPIHWLKYDKGYALVHEFGNEVRWIYMDGREAPEGDDILPTFNGYSVGHWDGEELVVETTGFKTQSEGGWPVWIQLGVRVTSSLKVEERYRLSDDGRNMDVKITMFDPTTFSHPWVTGKRFELRPDVDIMEFTCLADENVVTFKEDGSTGFKDFVKGN